MYFYIVLSLILIVFIAFSIKIQHSKRKKYNNCIKILKKKGDVPLNQSDDFDEEKIKQIDSSVNINELTNKLISKYIDFENKIKNQDEDLNNLLTGELKEKYESLISLSKSTGKINIVDDIEILNYAIIDFEPSLLNFRISVKCFHYKKNGTRITSGSNLAKVEQILILEYKKINGDWLISNYDKVIEKNLDETN
jgi:hypothetical protein